MEISLSRKHFQSKTFPVFLCYNFAKFTDMENIILIKEIIVNRIQCSQHSLLALIYVYCKNLSLKQAFWPNIHRKLSLLYGIINSENNKIPSSLFRTIIKVLNEILHFFIYDTLSYHNNDKR